MRDVSPRTRGLAVTRGMAADRCGGRCVRWRRGSRRQSPSHARQAHHAAGYALTGQPIRQFDDDLDAPQGRTMERWAIEVLPGWRPRFDGDLPFPRPDVGV